MTFDSLDDYESDWISSTCPRCARSIHIESGCAAECWHCGWREAQATPEPDGNEYEYPDGRRVPWSTFPVGGKS
jgi:hypothetical protein